MKLVRKVLPYLTQGIVACLSGLAFFYLWRKLCSVSSSISSDSTENGLRELEKWKRGTEADLSKLWERVQSALGRLDRAKRSEKASQEPQEGPPIEALDLNDQGVLNRVLARKFHGVG